MSGAYPPGYRLPIPENMRAYTIGAPNWDAWAECYYAIYDNEIGYLFHRQFNLAGADLALTWSVCGLFYLQLVRSDPAQHLEAVELLLRVVGGARAKNVVWQVAGHVDVGATAHFEGVVLCKTDITLDTGASIDGRLLSQTAVTIRKATVTKPAP